MNRKVASTSAVGSVFAVVALSATFAVGQQAPPTLDGKTAGEAFKNVKVLANVPADQLTQSMHVIKAAVGLDCEACHVAGDFPADTKPLKTIAREMMQMVIDLNKNSFRGQPEVTCYTCHRGSPMPANQVALPAQGLPEQAKVTLPSVDQILAKYVQALGGKEALRRVTTRVISGTQFLPTGPGGTVPMPAAIERDLKAPNLVLNIYRTPSYTISDGFDGSTQWSQNAQGRVTGAIRVDQERAKRAADFYEPLSLEQEYAELTVQDIEHVGDRDAYVVVGRPVGDRPERLYFDVESGLLLRKQTTLQTPAGNSPFDVNYEDYRDTSSGVKFPFVIRMDPAGPRTELGTAATLYVTKVQDNVPIADAKFTEPASRIAPPR